jgi:hypothetical protein
MASVNNHEFWVLCMKEVYDFYSNNLHILSNDVYDRLDKKSRIELILRIAGPKLFGRSMNNYKGRGSILPKEFFNPKIDLQFNWVSEGTNKYKEVYDYYQDLNSQEKEVFTRHYLTGVW